MHKLDANGALNALRAVVRDNESKIASCTYSITTYDDEGNCILTPECIVGAVMHKLEKDHGIEGLLKAMQDESILAKSTRTRLKELGLLHITHDALIILRAAQATQDNGIAWSKALAVASSVYAVLTDED